MSSSPTNQRRSLEDTLGPPSDAGMMAGDAIEARAGAFGDNDGHVMNARAFSREYVGRLLFVPERNDWFEHNGVVWVPGRAPFVMQNWAAAREQQAIVRHRRESSEESKFRLQHARTLLHSLYHQGMTLQAAAQRPEMRKSIKEFDQDAYRLAVQNGVLDLKRGELIPARADQYLMRAAPVAFERGAYCPEFIRFLKRVQPNRHVRRMIQRLVGYTLTGDVSEERFVFCHGTGANGKSVLLEAVAALLGDMCVNIPGDQLTSAKHQVQDAERIGDRIVGARLAMANEVREGAVWNEPLLKMLSSYDLMSARPYYAKAYDFKPTHTLWVRANYVPGSFDSSDGLVRRYLPINFAETIPPDERDPELARRIITNELPGVLAWAVDGARDWMADRAAGRDGLCIPKSVRDEQAEYKADADWFGRWLAECTIRCEESRIAETADLYESYRRFCNEGGMSAPSLIAFGKTMAARKFKRVKADRRHKAGYRGLRLQGQRSETF